MKTTQIFEELNETISSLSLNENVGNLNQHIVVVNQETETKKFENIASTSGSHQSHTSAKFQLQEIRKEIKKMMFSINPLEEAALLNIGFLGETHLNF
jgi:hypothetical protein